MSIYIEPSIKVCSDFKSAKEFFDRNNNYFYVENREKEFALSELVQGKRNLVVGEPGVGKSCLLENIQKYLNEKNLSVRLFELKKSEVIEEIKDFLNKNNSDPCYILLDALDEVQSNFLESTIKKIEEISEQYNDLSIYISSRWVFINRYFKHFPQYRFVNILPFSYSQVQQYLLDAGHCIENVEKLLKMMISGHHLCLVQIPRYLSYLNDFINSNDIIAASKISRNDLFEFFIYSKLDREEKKIQIKKKYLTKRMLEKIALVMEIYQKNVITKDELMTIFDDLKSDLKLVALSQIDLEIFFDYSLLKDNHDSIEFENTEIQEYLAAKEITRFPNPYLAVFNFSTNLDLKEIYPTWYNALIFLVDMQPAILEQLIEFSQIRNVENKLVQPEFFIFISRVNHNNLSIEFKRKIFNDVFTYHQRMLQLLPTDLASSISNFFDQSLEAMLIKEINQDLITKLDVAIIGNILYVVSYLMENKVTINEEFWKSKLMLYVKDNNHSVLQQISLFGLKTLKDSSVINDLPNLMHGSEKFISDIFISTCASLDPDHPKTIEYLIQAVKTSSYVDIRHFFSVKKRGSIKKICNEFLRDDRFRVNFLSNFDLSRNQIDSFTKNLKDHINGSLNNFFTRVLLKTVKKHEISTPERNKFFIIIWNILKNKNSKFLENFLRSLKLEAGNIFCGREFLTIVLCLEDVEIFINTLTALGDKFFALSVLSEIRSSKNPLGDMIYEAGRSVIPDDYNAWEDSKSIESKKSLIIKKQNKEYLKQFRKRLEPAPDSYSQDIFQFYNNNRDRLISLICEEDRNRLCKLVDFILSRDSRKFIVKISHEGGSSTNISMSGEIPLFNEAISTAKYLKLDFDKFRQNIINFIPYLDSNFDKKNIFEIIGNIMPEEAAQLLETYSCRDSDSWQYKPENFIEFVERYRLINTVPILKELIKEKKFGIYFREKALVIIDSLIADRYFLNDIFESYKDQSEDEQELANIANGLLITVYEDEMAIKWRLNQVVERARKFIEPSGTHEISSLEREIRFSSSFAKPLMELNCSNYSKEYLELLENALNIYSRGQEFHAYFDYLLRIVFAYFENIKGRGSYNSLFALEKKITEMGYDYKIYSLNYLLINLRRSYLLTSYPQNISQAIKNYNNAHNYDDKQILNSINLLQHLLDGLEIDLRRWIEGEGAYNLILGEKVYDAKKQEYEILIQKTIKTQIENFFLKRGFQIRLDRESQLLDSKRVDFLVWYGFVGPILIEVKLVSSSDMGSANIEQTDSFKNMKHYMDGYGAAYGIFLLILNKESDNVQNINEIFQKIDNVYVKSFSIFSLKPKKKKKRNGVKNSQEISEAETPLV